jgi:hypothetical protein
VNNNEKDLKKKREKNKSNSIVNYLHIILKMEEKAPSISETKKLIIAKKNKFLPQLKFIIHQEEDLTYNLDDNSYIKTKKSTVNLNYHKTFKINEKKI